MEEKYEDAYAVVEERHPWFVARRELFTTLAGAAQELRILDIGCGTGMFLTHLAARGFRHLAGVETSAQLRGRFRDPALELFESIPEGPRDLVFMLDVLEHIEDDRGTLERVLALLEPGGKLYLSVPAHPFLWSHHDELNHHVRRYRRKELQGKLLEAGFRVERMSYWNVFSFAPVCLVRWLGLGKKTSELELGQPWVLWILLRILRLENWLLLRMNLPPGVSLVAVAHKPR